ncbi:MAG: hypothetical protein JST92_18545 [Deltaproteobacteria bacterium]|nr:hypothetical protein [Deltaproteobacteria bacterium]
MADRARLLQTVEEASMLLDRVRSMKDERRYADAARELSSGYPLLGLTRRSMQLSDPIQVPGELTHPELIRALGELLANEADLLRLEGDHDSSVATARWTLALLLRGAPPGDYSTLTRALLALAEGQPPPEPL